MAPPSENLLERVTAARGVLELLLTTELSLEQKHYALALGSLLADAAEDRPTTPPAADETYIDREVLTELYRYLPPSSCAAILGQFRGTAQELLDAALAALAAEQAEDLARTAHSLIGTAGAVGMVLLAQEARAIVIALREGDWRGAAARAAHLPSLYEASSRALEATVAELNSGSA
ncbi:MAG: Hpt domain-containing protein [Elstera sp.]